MAEAQNLVITHLGLSKTAAELINQRIFDSSQVSLQGPVNVDNTGNAFGFNQTSYIYHSGLIFGTAESIRVKFVGNFVPNRTDSYQCCWSIVNPSSYYDNISLCVKSDSIMLLKGLEQEFILNNLSFSTNDYIDIDLTITSASYSIIVKHTEGVYTSSGSLNNALNFQLYSELTIGWTSINDTYFWNSRINLNNFILYKDRVVYYSTSKDSFIHFSKILIGDGTYPLSDNSNPVLNHVYEITISDISRTANTIIIRAEIGENVNLKISELGLYVRMENGNSALFGLAKGLSITKVSDLEYTLVFKLDVTLNIVNAFIVPNIVIKDSGFITLEELHNLERVYANVVTDLERPITNNSKLIGYARTLSANSFMNANDECQRNFAAVNEYNILKNDVTSGSVQDFYAFSSYPYLYSLFYSYNLSGLNNSRIRVLEGALKGRLDAIDFGNENGFTLCVNSSLKNVGDKIIVAKVDTVFSPYFSLELKDSALLFKIYMVDGQEIIVSKEFSALEFQNIVRNDYLITITFEVIEGTFMFKMYGGDTLLTETAIDNNNFKGNPESYFITNYLSSENISEENYVKNIISFEGALSSSDIAFVNTLLGSNV